jgi:hypothetical protein
MLSLNRSGFPHYDFPTELQVKLRGGGLDCHGHVVNYYPFLLGSVVNETSGPSLESFESEWEGILAGLESWALVNHHLVSCEHVAGLEIFHLVVTTVGSSNVTRMPLSLVTEIALGFAIGYAKILNL